ncbi:Kinesin-like_protein [Hexamita inflata]|uniref:Kinesin-like protein n=1 Tax=Hexamita inflata TaxID=28002 RepID=A0AA86PNT0_9EUKA|nr:Kinesin-like protein [Hexamita inflata]
MDTFQVAVRVRPQNQKELLNQSKSILQIQNGKQIVFDPATTESASGHVRQKNLGFSYDYVYNEKSTNTQIFNEAVNPLLDKLFAGFNLTVFAYGATSSGKTFTIQGSQSEPGILFQSLEQLFKRLQPDQTLKMSFVEIYNEQINDLLNTKNVNLQLRDDVNAVQIVNLTQIKIESIQQTFLLINKAFQFRQTQATGENANSSRSHSILQFDLQTATNTVKFLIIDLAGSERLKRTNCEGQRMLEGCSINKSLLALGNCLSALCRNNSYVPFRNSKLTRILKETLSGQSKVLMMCNVTSSDLQYEDTLNSLTYAQRATYIKCQSKINIQSIQLNQTELNQIIQQLKEENQQLIQDLEKAKITQHLEDTTELDTILKELIESTSLLYLNQCDRKYLEFENNTENVKKIGELQELEQLALEQSKQLKDKLKRFTTEKAQLKIQNAHSKIQENKLSQLSILRGKIIEQMQNINAHQKHVIIHQQEVFEQLSQLAAVALGESEVAPLIKQFKRAPKQTQAQQAKSADDLMLSQLNTQQINTTQNFTKNINICEPKRIQTLEKWNANASRVKIIPGLTRKISINKYEYENQLDELTSQLNNMSGSIRRK